MAKHKGSSKRWASAKLVQSVKLKRLSSYPSNLDQAPVSTKIRLTDHILGPIPSALH